MDFLTLIRMENHPRAGRTFEAHVHCQSCSIRKLCFPFSLGDDEIVRLDNIIKRNRPLQRHEHLFRAGDRMQHVYALRSGSLKCYLLNADGSEQITGFYLPGELIGLDGFGTGTYPTCAAALETTLVCAVSLTQLEELAGTIPHLRKHLLRALSREIHDEQEHFTHNRETAEQRLAAFLLNLSARYARRGLSATDFILPMSRGEIGNYLSLTTETISRLFTRYRQQGLLNIDGREIHLLNPAALCHLGVA
ncbi:CRP/FNR family transcriptional regulator, anaerobic regulatory protein [Pseudomonas indica]|uniref:CRP/FNR family transcriptional regulator, anaerobic regulatory protein n=2 Tax=Pseudomonas indica TaxID=137658 RepID=A0A1G9BUY2_9PSED|nr:CRP/FNR family transcriptional regulator, anaerobic regulatory protein [Pseudomonas indica]